MEEKKLEYEALPQREPRRRKKMKKITSVVQFAALATLALHLNPSLRLLLAMVKETSSPGVNLISWR